MHDDWEQIRWEVDDVFEAEHGIVTFHRVIARGRASGLELTDSRFGLYEVRDGLIVKAWIYADRDEVLAAAGPRR
jgi:ketosteroid isomerase-like protein